MKKGKKNICVINWEKCAPRAIIFISINPGIPLFNHPLVNCPLLTAHCQRNRRNAEMENDSSTTSRQPEGDAPLSRKGKPILRIDN
ncbi:hypothetical protein POVCU2_0045490 [Plasmodium ovale curtisi]|uniref:Uncharacterized protein n=1 Tax=Plasmodium ovale curtisi TaxID=864141 RepID=A0A1A8X1A1_PLAOA|nr:hypothetical protein POVCU2_0045490 [Plasmodium ovale curtisi]SBS97942.1 hypothetical protein POVCU1_042230 [Plasmodium ovale curtisi]